MPRDQALIDDEREAVQKVFAEPVMPELSESAGKIRRNLLLTSVLALGFYFAGLKLGSSESMSMGGVKIEGLEFKDFLIGLLILNNYFLVHFVWMLIDYWRQYRIRVTGTRVAFQTATVPGNGQEDVIGDPQQASLYGWWLQYAKRFGSHQATLEDVRAKIAELQRVPTSEPVAVALLRSIQELAGPLGFAREIMDHQRIPFSLQRFDETYRAFVTSQGARFALIDGGLPVVLGIWAIAILCRQLFLG